jgi:LCP family protein required for cell wall assembly
LRAVVFGALVAVAVLGGLLVALGTEQVDGAAESVGRVDDAFPDDADRPAPTGGSALTFLLVGVDPSDAATGGTRAEATLLVRLTGDRQHVQAVTLAPDTWVEAQGSTVEEAFTADGPEGAVRAVETLSGVRVDHYAELDLAGLAAVTDALGGITVDVPSPYRNRGHDFAPGPQLLDGERTVAYVRDESAATRAGAADRYRRVVQGLFERVRELGTFTDVGRLSGLLPPLTSTLRVDTTLADEALVATVWEFRGVPAPDFLTAPTTGVTEEDGRQVSRLDEERAATLWRHLREDTLAAHVDEFR